MDVGYNLELSDFLDGNRRPSESKFAVIVYISPTTIAENPPSNIFLCPLYEILPSCGESKQKGVAYDWVSIS